MEYAGSSLCHESAGCSTRGCRMWNITAPATDEAVEDLTKALTYVNGKPVYPLKPPEITAVEALYNLYDFSRGAPAAALKSGGLGSALVQAIYDAYSEVQKGGRLAKMRTEL